MDCKPGTGPENQDFRGRLLQGMATAVRERGFRDTTVADVVRHARTSRRTFYAYFPDKQACYIALLQEANAAMVRQIAAAVDRRAPWDTQIRQAVEAWIAAAQSDLALTLSWIRDLPSLGADARHLQREWLEAFIVLIEDLATGPELRAAGVTPPSRQLMIMLLGGLRELIATTGEDGGDIGGITEVAVQATQALLGPRKAPVTPKLPPGNIGTVMSRGGTGVQAVKDDVRARDDGDERGSRVFRDRVFRRDRGRGQDQPRRRYPGDDRGHRAGRSRVRAPR